MKKGLTFVVGGECCSSLYKSKRSSNAGKSPGRSEKDANDAAGWSKLWS